MMGANLVYLDSINEMEEELHEMLLKVVAEKEFKPIYQKEILEKREITEVRYFEMNKGTYIRGYGLCEFNVIYSGTESEYVDIKKEITLLENGEYVVFNHLEKYCEDPDDDTFYTISTREISGDQTLSVMEYSSVMNKIEEELNDVVNINLNDVLGGTENE